MELKKENPVTAPVVLAHAKTLTKAEIMDAICNKLMRHFGVEIGDATEEQIYQVVASTVRDEVMEKRTHCRGQRKLQRAKKLYYMSAEFLVGRTLYCNMINLKSSEAYMEALAELGVDAATMFDREPEPGLGNGGLGRLAACFLDSLATLDLPATGCSIRYEYGLFRQRIVDGFQVELPDNWLENGNAWEICRPNETVEVKFGGRIVEDWSTGKLEARHVDFKTVLAVPYDMPVLGFGTSNVRMLRLWSARSPKTLDMAQFNRGQYTRSLEEKELAEVISKVLYPEDNHYEGKELRLKQHYFLSSATVQHAVRDFLALYGDNWRLLPEKIALHVNDTHPGLAIPELMRILLDDAGLPWEEAEYITRHCFAYTNHTIMAEALERWPVDMVRTLLPRIFSILEELNRRQCERLFRKFPGQWDRIGHMAILSYGSLQMANLCVYMSHKVNGVSQLHADIIKKTTFHDYYLLTPEKFLGITNGITHRRWLMQCNPSLSALLDECIGQGWRKDAAELEKLTPFTQDAAFLQQFAQVKAQNKLRLAKWFADKQGVALNTSAIFDVQAKRLHEYKRQLLNILHVLILYNRIVENPALTMQPRTFIFGAKASPGYYRAKLIIRLINAVGQLIAAHPRASQMLQVAFLENYCVSAAELLIPAAEVSEQLSTAGKEASGTGNMKFMMNGATTIGTLDGANVEICDLVGEENMYIFGLRTEEVEKLYASDGYRASEEYETHPELRHAMEQMIDGTLCPEQPRLFQDLYHALLFGDGGGMADPYLVLKDLDTYMAAHARLARDYGDPEKWWRMAALNTAKSGFFSSDRTIREYNSQVWRLKPLKL